MILIPTLKRLTLYALIFLFPVFFLPFSQEFFITQKIYLFAFGSLLLLLLSIVELLIERKILWHTKTLDAPVFLFILTTALSILFSSQNKVQAIFNLNFGLLGIICLGVLYFYISRQSKNVSHVILSVLGISVWIASIISIIFFFQPFKSVSLPSFLLFLKSPTFNTVGDQLTLVTFLLTCSLISGHQLIKSKGHGTNLALNAVSLVLFIAALALAVFSLANITANFTNLVLPPYRLSWYAAVETLKSPLTALFGVGIDNYPSIFTRVKDVIYNQSPIWQIPSFTVARSGVLHIFTEAGLLGLLAFIFIVITALSSPKRSFIPHLVIVLIIFTVFPPSFPLFFMLFLVLGLIAQEQGSTTQEVDLTHLPIVYAGLAVLGVAIIGAAGYFLGRTYIAEYHHKRAIDGLNGVGGINVYEEERKALQLNNAMEKYHVTFSTINMILANNIAKKDAKKITADDRQVVSQAIQTAITEAKYAVSLNPQKAGNWENLAAIYRNILSVVQGADVWTVVAYQRAIITDPQNPVYRTALGGVYYSLKNYEEAKKMFEQAVSLKPNWPNAYYNLAWSSYEKGDYQLAANAMQNVLALLDQKKDANDYKKAQKELEDFKKKIPKPTEAVSPTPTPGNTQLKLPSTVPTNGAPKINLPEPETASPEASQ